MPVRPGLLVLLALALVGCGAVTAGDIEPGRAGRADGIRYTIPAGWRAAKRTLTPHLTNPHEVLTVGTGALRAGGRCAQFPSAALAAMGPSDALVTVQERLGSVASFPARPRRFSLPPVHDTSEAARCAGQGASFTSYWFEFRDGGRGFHALVAIGAAASAARAHEALAVLDSLRITPRRPVRIDPDDAIPYDEPRRGLHLVHPSAWRLYPRALTEAVSARDQIALGTFRLHQTTPDHGCTPATALRSRPRGGGFVFLFEYEGLNRTQLARFPRRPARLHLRRSSYAQYECFGPSWLVRFRDAGRAFQAHVYGPRARRREALAILDSLRVSP